MYNELILCFIICQGCWFQGMGIFDIYKNCVIMNIYDLKVYIIFQGIRFNILWNYVNFMGVNFL